MNTISIPTCSALACAVMVAIEGASPRFKLPFTVSMPTSLLYAVMSELLDVGGACEGGMPPTAWVGGATSGLPAEVPCC